MWLASRVWIGLAGLLFASLVYGAYYDDELAELLDIDGVTETVVSVMLIGKEAPPAPEPA